MKVTEVGAGVLFVEGPDVNWTILRDGRRFTLVDAGFPGYTGRVVASLRQCGLALEGLDAIVVTHAHVDHIGGVPALLEARDVPVYVGQPEVDVAVGARRESAGPLDVVKRLWKPRYLPWSARIARAGGAKHVVVPSALGVSDGATLHVPGQPTTILTPGHTSGHLCLQAGDALLTGDALITGHGVSGRVGPQMLPGFFHTDQAKALAALDRLSAVNASVLLPGHGPLWRGAMRDAVAIARG